MQINSIIELRSCRLKHTVLELNKCYRNANMASDFYLNGRVWINDVQRIKLATAFDTPVFATFAVGNGSYRDAKIRL